VLTRMLARRYPRVPLFALDPAQRMLRRARNAVPRMKRAIASLTGVAPHWVCGDAAHLPMSAGSLAFIWSNLMLQTLTDPAAVFSEWHRVLKPGGLVMFSTLGPDSLRELRIAFAAADRSVHVQSFIDMHDLGDMLVHAGFADPVMDMEAITLTYPSAVALLHELRELGSVVAHVDRNRGLMGKAGWARMIGALESDVPECRICLTFEIVYGHAWKPGQDPSRMLNGTQVIRVHRGRPR